MAKYYIARRDGLWTAISLTPDVCKTPMGPATPPVPYPVTASRGDAVRLSRQSKRTDIRCWYWIKVSFPRQRR